MVAAGANIVEAVGRYHAEEPDSAEYDGGFLADVKHANETYEEKVAEAEIRWGQMQGARRTVAQWQAWADEVRCPS